MCFGYDDFVKHWWMSVWKKMRWNNLGWTKETCTNYCKFCETISAWIQHCPRKEVKAQDQWKPSQQRKPLEIGRYKLNFDGAVNKTNKNGRHRSYLQKWRSHGSIWSRIPSIVCPFIVEANAAICSLKLAQQMNLYNVEIERDALGIIRKLLRKR